VATLEDHQRGLLDLIKRRETPTLDPYLHDVSASAGLGVIREIALFWRMFQIEAQCRFTSRLLRRLASFEVTVRRYFESHHTSTYVEELSRDFLKSLETHAEPLVRVVAQFELAVLEVKSGSTEVFEMLWDRDPLAVLRSLESSHELPPSEPSELYRLTVDASLPDLVVCSRVEINKSSQ
jgi:hypothetical protein